MTEKNKIIVPSIEIELNAESQSIDFDIATVIDNYNALSNRPKINNIVLEGNKTLNDLGAANIGDLNNLSNIVNTKQDKITINNKLDYSLISNTPNIPTKTSDLTNDSGFLTSHQDISGKVNISDIVNDTSHTDTNKPLSANIGKELQDEIDNLKARGRFLALWNSKTGLAMSNPQTSPYTYSTGDYFIVGEIDTTTNYKPNGSSYTIGVASTTVETNDVSIDDVYYYDGENWRLQVNTQKTVGFANLSGNPTDNTNLASVLNSKLSTDEYGFIEKTSLGLANSDYSKLAGLVCGTKPYVHVANEGIMTSMETLRLLKTDNYNMTTESYYFPEKTGTIIVGEHINQSQEPYVQSIKVLTQTEYDNLPSKDNNTMYVIVG